MLACRGVSGLAFGDHHVKAGELIAAQELRQRDTFRAMQRIGKRHLVISNIEDSNEMTEPDEANSHKSRKPNSRSEAAPEVKMRHQPSGANITRQIPRLGTT